jgi:hypothetical protein
MDECFPYDTMSFITGGGVMPKTSIKIFQWIEMIDPLIKYLHPGSRDEEAFNIFLFLYVLSWIEGDRSV